MISSEISYYLIIAKLILIYKNDLTFPTENLLEGGGTGKEGRARVKELVARKQKNH